MNATTTTAATDAVIHEIPLEQLHDSPFNPRRVYTALEELADSIRAEGRIHEPLLVRPRMTNPLRDDIQEGWEIVFGHRRRRAAELAGLPTAPCMVRAMTDAEARSAQAAENLQRENVHAFEEAEGYQAMIDNDGLTADQVAERVGKSRTHVYGRLKLLQACAQVRAACLAGEIGAETALLVARLRTDKLQAKALAAIKGKFYDLADGGAKSFRQIRALLNELFALDLRQALWALDDATLLPGAGACTDCPKRTGNAPEYADVAAQTERDARDHGDAADWHRDHLRRVRNGGANVCTDPDCWAAKKAAHLAREAARLQAEGHEVVTGNKARQAVSATGEVKGSFVALDTKVAKALKKAGAQAPKPVLVQDPRTGKAIKAVRRDDLVQAGLPGLAPPPAPSRVQRDDPQERKRREAEHAREQQQRETELAQRRALLNAVREAAARRARDAYELRLAAAATLRGLEWDDRPLLCTLYGVKSLDALEAALDAMSPDQLGLLLLDCALVEDVSPKYGPLREPKALHGLARHYGLDPKAVRAEATGQARDNVTGDLLAVG